MENKENWSYQKKGKDITIALNGVRVLQLPRDAKETFEAIKAWRLSKKEPKTSISTKEEPENKSQKGAYYLLSEHQEKDAEKKIEAGALIDNMLGEFKKNE